MQSVSEVMNLSPGERLPAGHETLLAAFEHT
jgi:hypothetical protein